MDLRRGNEGFTEDYDLPNDTAYAETCASVALIFWAQRMLHLDLDGTYADVLERSLFNGALAGLSRDGCHYFYENPLESDGQHNRWAWHHCPCCTMNVSRLVASIGGYLFSQSGDGIALHLYGGATLKTTLKGKTLKIVEESNYPWSGEISVRIETGAPVAFDLLLRIPGWANGAQVKINGRPAGGRKSLVQGYVNLSRTWSNGDVVSLSLPMPAERTYAHPDVKADIGRVALTRGPLVYCLEQVDNPAMQISGYRLYRDSKLCGRLPKGTLFRGFDDHRIWRPRIAGRLGQCTLPQPAAQGRAEQDHGNSLLPLVQPGQRTHDSLDPGGIAAWRKLYCWMCANPSAT